MANYSLVGIDGNAFAIMGYVIGAMRECGKSSAERQAYQTDAMSSDYNHLLCASIDMINELNELNTEK